MTEHRLRAQWLKQDKAAIDAAFGALLQHNGGRKMLWWLLQIGKVGQQPFSNNALQTAFACGELNVGQQILDRITSVSPEGYLEMIKEMADERRRRDSALNDARNSGTGNSDPTEPGDPDSADS
jgi:hypothetical protein